MTARVVLACDGMEGFFECRQAIPVGKVMTGVDARRIAKRDGWSSRLEARPAFGMAYHAVDYCPSCTRKQR